MSRPGLGSVALLGTLGSLSLSLIVAASALAQKHAEPAAAHFDSTMHEAAKHQGEEHHEGGHHTRNDLGIFVGAARNHSHETVSFTLGIDYLRKFGPNLEWAVGVEPEYSFAEEPEFIVLGMGYRSFGSFYIRSGVGIGFLFANKEEGHDSEDDHEASARRLPKLADEEPGHGDSGEEGNQSTALFRIGIGYGFTIAEGWYATPSFDLDFGGHRNRFAVLGITFAKGF